MSHLLVTGGAGYIGSHTLRGLQRAGHSAVVIDDLRAGNAMLVHDAALIRCDIADRAAVSRVFEEHGPFDGVLHFAAYLFVAESVSKPLDYYANNVGGSIALLDVAIAQDTPAFVFSSSCATYGVPDRVPISEDTPLAPINPYGASKLMVERVLADAETAHGLRWAALRYFNACGADPDGDIGECHDPEIHLIPSCLEAVAGIRERLQLYGTDYPTPDGSCIRDYIHVTDLANAHVCALEALIAGRSIGVRNLGTGRGHSNREVIAAIERVVGRAVPIEQAARRPGDPPELVADASAFRSEFGWEPRHSDLDTIVTSSWAWLQRWKNLS
jgi:UDP-glucose-4-epimerase GalE